MLTGGGVCCSPACCTPRSSVTQFECNMAALGKGPLPPAVVAAFDAGWELCRTSSPDYQRGVSGSARG